MNRHPETRRYAVFAWNYGCEMGGWYDFVGTVAFLSSAPDFAESYGNCWCVVDLNTREIVARSKEGGP